MTDTDGPAMDIARGHLLTSFVLSAFQPGPGAGDAFAEINLRYPSLTFMQAAPALIAALRELGQGTPMVENCGIDVLREQLAQTYTYLPAEAGRTHDDAQ
ncbi:MAG: hypothetical protein JWR37_1040 [Mycobacterium sp.]|nr:hypothetical protein [Mycobacterium sp.]